MDELLCEEIIGASFAIACPMSGKLISKKIHCDRVCDCKNCDDEWHVMGISTLTCV